MSEEKKLWEIIITTEGGRPGVYPLKSKAKYFCAAMASTEDEARALLYKLIKSDIKFDIVNIKEAKNNRPVTIIGGIRYG